MISRGYGNGVKWLCDILHFALIIGADLLADDGETVHRNRPPFRLAEQSAKDLPRPLRWFLAVCGIAGEVDPGILGDAAKVGG